jgi:cell division protein FtsI/penicillin-binding protein 2
MKSSLFNRLNSLGIILSIVAGLIEFQLIRFQTSPSYQKVSQWADEQFTYQKQMIYPERGNIYDRYGRLLVGNEEVYEVGVLLQFVKNPKTIADTLKDLPDVNYDEVLKAASLDYQQGVREYAVLANFVPAGIIDIIRQIKGDYEADNPNGEDPNKPSLRGLVWYSQLKRSYPENQLAANILGFYPYKEKENAKGQYGVEEYFNDILAGTPQKISTPLDPYLINEIPQLPTGASIVLTIDREIQAMVENILDEAVKKNQAASGTVIVMDPRNGEILAMASQPRLDPNNYWVYEKELKDRIPFNRAVSETYEPGSVFKPLTMATALDLGKVTPDTTFNDPGIFKYYGSVIYDWNRRAWGEQTMTTCLQHSLNVCLSWVATQIGADDFYRYMQAFGIGRRTNIDLGGEQIWPLLTPKDEGKWYPVNLVTNSFGQGVSVTPIQLATAISAIANDGKMMKPHVLKAIIDNGVQTDVTPQVLGTPITEQTAHTLTNMLATSLELEASTSLVPGYRLAGKTGTAEIPTGSGYDENLTNASFVGWGPIDDPRFLVYIWLEKPASNPWGSIVAAPVFHDIVQQLVVMMDIPADAIRQKLNAPSQ